MVGSSILIVLVAVPAFGASSNTTARPGVGALGWINGIAGHVADNRDHLYVLDGWGGVHPFGSAPPLVDYFYAAGDDAVRGGAGA